MNVQTVRRVVACGLITAAVIAGCSSGAEQSETGSEFDTEFDSELEIIAGPAETTTDRFAVFRLVGEPVECSLDGGAFEACRSPVFLPDVGHGVHVLDVRLMNGGETSASWEWEVIDLWHHPTDDLVPATRQPEPAEPQSWRGIFRINCDFSHSSYNDPIVFPDDEGAAHLHRFYGNMAVDHTTTTASLFTDGASTCQGNRLNASGYWIPALLAADAGSDDGWTPVPAVVGGSDEAHEVFYYSAGIDDLEAISPIPVGLRIIAGDMTATPDRPQAASVARWHCQSWEANDATNPRFSSTIPACEAPDRVRLDVFFPSCWNGVDLDSADHESHMAYPVSTSEGDRGGASLHADWINGWHPSVMEAILAVCIQGRLDCHDGNLANGFRLGDVQPGIQNDPTVVNDGRGAGG